MGLSPAQECDAITQAIQPYLDGARLGQGAVMKAAFHDDATVYGYIGRDLIAGPMKVVYDWTDSLGPSPNIAPRIVKVDVAGKAANVRIEVDGWQQYRFTDIFNLMKIGGKWLVVSKIFHTHE